MGILFSIKRHEEIVIARLPKRGIMIEAPWLS